MHRKGEKTMPSNNSKYTDEEILTIVKNQDYSHNDISLLCQEVVLQ